MSTGRGSCGFGVKTGREFCASIGAGVGGGRMIGPFGFIPGAIKIGSDTWAKNATAPAAIARTAVRINVFIFYPSTLSPGNCKPDHNLGQARPLECILARPGQDLDHSRVVCFRDIRYWPSPSVGSPLHALPGTA